MKWLIILTIAFLLCFNLYVSNKKSQNEFKENVKKVRTKRRISVNLTSSQLNSRKILPLKSFRRLPTGKDGQEFIVDRRNQDSIDNFLTNSGKIIGRLVLQNFNTPESISDVVHHRMVRGAKLDLRRQFFDFSDTDSSQVKLELDNCNDGWFPFEEFILDGRISKEVIHIKETDILCTSQPKYLKLIEKYGSFAVNINHNCDWRFWNFDLTNVNISAFDPQMRPDLAHHSYHRIAFLKVKGFGNDLKTLQDWLVKPLRLDWIRDVGLDEFTYQHGCLRFEGTDPLGIFQFKALRQLHFNRENFKKSAPFVIDGRYMGCLPDDKRIELVDKFGNVALQILDDCPKGDKILVLDGRQPFEFVKNRPDIKFHPGDHLLFARIRYFTEKEHLDKMHIWFEEMGFHNVVFVGKSDEIRKTPDVAVIGCISTFFPFPFIQKTDRLPVANEHTIPVFYFRNNSGNDCLDRRLFRTLRRSVGMLSLVEIGNCECGKWTSSEYFWNYCLTYRGTLELKGSELQRYKNLRNIQGGNLWIHNTKDVRRLDILSKLKSVQCERNSLNFRKSIAVRVDEFNTGLESIDLPNLEDFESCDHLFLLDGDRNRLPRYAESKWMEKEDENNIINIIKENKRCIAYSGNVGGLSTEFHHQLDGCVEIEGDLIVDGEREDVSKITIALRNIRRIRGNVMITNIVEKHCRLLENVQTIDGSLTYMNNPNMEKVSFGILNIQGNIRILRSPRLCWKIQNIRPILKTFRNKTVDSDCAIYSEANIFSHFEDKIGDINIFTSLMISFSAIVLVYHMAPEVFLNFTIIFYIHKIRVATELDERLKTDTAAYLDEESSEEEPDVVTWKRKMMMRDRLDGRDLIGEEIQKEKQDFKEGRQGVRFVQRMGALMRNIRRRNDEDSECSDPSWLRKNRNQKSESSYDDEDLPLAIRNEKVERPFNIKPKNPQEEIRNVCARKIQFYDVLNDTIEKTMKEVKMEENDQMTMVMDMLKKRNILKNKKTPKPAKIRKKIVALGDELHKLKLERWDARLESKLKLRQRAMESAGVKQKNHDVTVSQFGIENEEIAAVTPVRGYAGKQEQFERRGMFAKIIVETLNWRPSDEEN